MRPILIARKTENENQPKGPCIRHRWFSKKVKFVTLSPRKRKPTHDCLLTRVTRLGIRKNTPPCVGISSTLQVLSLVFSHSKVKYAAAFITLLGHAAAFAPSPASKKSSALAFSVDTIPGAFAPAGLFFDPLGFAPKADEPFLKRHREAELIHCHNCREAKLAVSS